MSLAFHKSAFLNPFIQKYTPQYILSRLRYPKNKCHYISSEGYAAHPVGVQQSLKIIMAVCRTLLKFEPVGSGVGSSADYTV